ncbi:THO complex subunit 1 [Rhypophila sp. PSN 637]
MPSAVSPSDGIPAVASVKEFLNNLLARAESIKSTSIEPALEKSDFPDLILALNDVLGPGLSQASDSTDPNRVRRFAIIEAAARDTFTNLIATTSIDSPSFVKIWNLLDILSILSDGEHCDPALPLWLVEELLDSQTIPGCHKVFDYLESRRERITSKHFKQKQLVILRTCNELLRRLSRATDSAFCGRVFIFMFQSFPLGDKSSVNLRGEYHVENVTTYDRDGTEAVDKMDIDAETPGDDTHKGDSQKPSSKAAESKKQTEKPLDPDALYPVFWSLQDSFNQPKKLFDAEHFASFKKALEATLTTFRTIKESPRGKEKDKQSDESKRASKRKLQETDSELATSFNPKYLTSRDLFKLEISDLSFRRNILVQVLIVMDFLLSLSAKAKEKLATIKTPNKSVTYADQLLSEEDTKWVTKMKHAISDYLKSGSDGPYFFRMIETVLSRDKNWVRWKIENCPSIELPPLKPETFVEAKSSLSKLAAKKKIRPTPMGSLNLDFLNDEEDDIWEKLKNPERTKLPDLKSFQRKIADLDFEIEMPSSAESKAAAIEGKASQSWLALRMASTFKLAAFDKIDDDDKLDALFEDDPVPQDVDTPDGGEAKGDGDVILPEDSRVIFIVDGSSIAHRDGKSVMASELVAKYASTFTRVPPHVTRKPQEGEANGKDCHFIDQQAFNMMRDGDQFLAYTERTDNSTGISRKVVEGISDKGKVPVLELDRDSAQQVKDMEFPARYLFIHPPAPAELEAALRSSGRGLTDDQIKDVLKTTAELAYHATTTSDFYDSILAHDGEVPDEGPEFFKKFERIVFGSALEKAQAANANGTANGDDVAMADAGNGSTE